LTKPRVLFPFLLLALLAARLCHTGILWAEETLPLAAAQQIRLGHMLYRDIWFDKPPLVVLLHLPLGPGWTLRAAGAVYAFLACCIIWCFARDLWGQAEAAITAALLAFFLIFATPSAVTPLATDMLMLAPHLAAVWMAYRRRPLLAGVFAGVAFWISPKGLFVLAACAVWNPAVLLFAGFAVVAGIGAIVVPAAYWGEVWRWGRIYAGAGFSLSNAVSRTANWFGFHAACIAGLRAGEFRKPRWILWLAISFAGVAAGFRFFPRYYLQLLPVFVLLAARGYTQLQPKWRWVALLLLIPLIRFSPTYREALHPDTWRDTSMDQDSRATASLLRRLSRPGDSLFVWGYRPEIYVYSHLPAATRYLDSQPLTGIPADRHLTDSTPVETTASAAHRAELTATHPTLIVDGLGLYNPRLALSTYPDLTAWFSSYREVARTPHTIIYCLLPNPTGLPLP
jgi:hypothetical protein